jgi:molybdopterin-containing oxidoreductase family membrane subunit
MATTTKIKTTPNTRPSLIVLGILVIIGIVAWVIQLTKGMSVIGVGQVIVWGIYIATFFFLVGIAGGVVILTALADLQVIPGLHLYRRRLLIGALAAYVAGGFMILMDIGRPLRVLNMIFFANITSPFVWDFAFLVVSVIVTAIYLFSAPKGKLLPVLAAIVAGVVIMVEGWILSMSARASLWHGGITPATFLIEGLISASAIMLIVQVEYVTTQWLRRVVLTLLPVLVLLNLLEIASVSYAGEPEAQAAIGLMLSNPLYWVVLLLGIVLPFVLLAWWGMKRQALLSAGVLMLVAIFVSKILLLVSGQALPAFMPSPEIYVPTLVEIGGVVGIFGLAGLIYLLGLQLVRPKTVS